jgi:hypothetical protein
MGAIGLAPFHEERQPTLECSDLVEAVRQYKLTKCKRVHGLHFAPDGSRLLAVGGAEVRMVDSAVWLDLATGENTGRVDQFAQCYAVPPDLDRCVIGGANQWGRIPSVAWVVAQLPGWQSFSAAGGKPPAFREVGGLAFDATGKRLAIYHSQRVNLRSNPYGWCAVTVVDRDTGAAEARFNVNHEACVMAFNVAGSRLACTGGIDGGTTAGVYELPTAEPVFTFKPPGTVTRCVQFLPDDRLVVANGRYVYVLPPGGGEPLFTLAGHPKQVNAVALTPDGNRLLTASHDGAIRTWDASTGEPGPAFDWQIGAVTAVAFAPDGLTCAAAGLNGKVVVWDVDG